MSRLCAILLLFLATTSLCTAIRLPWFLQQLPLPFPSSSEPPAWPDSYSVTYIFSLPYTSEVQGSMVNYTVTLYRDAESSPRVRMETLDGTNVVIASSTTEYEITPRLEEQVCRVNKDIEEGEGNAGVTALPDISGWDYYGNTFINGQQSDVWQYQRHHESKTVQYRFYVNQDGKPVRLHMIGNDVFSGAHFDEWVADYIDFQPGRPAESVFDPPEICKRSEVKTRTGTSPAAVRMMNLAPTVRYGGEHAAYDEFLTTGHGKNRRHASLVEYRQRLAIFQKNTAMIETHNAAPSKTFKMAMNRFGDWTREEFLAVMLPRKARQQRRSAAAAAENLEEEAEHQVQHKPTKHEFPYEPLTDVSRIPTTVDWRGTGADVNVYDQANCGSCWAFGAAGALESAWFHATGESSSFSEQQIMDCSWGFVPGEEDRASACDGGDAWAGVGHVVDAGGVALLSNYQYLGQNDYCRESSKPLTGGKFKGYARIPRYNDSALMEAVYSRGPVTVSLDASQDSFTFYSSGVYYDTNCMWKPKDLDHSMMVVGYGTDPAGDYWLVKNSWSTHWGDRGYVKISRDNHGCGASTDAIYALVDEEGVGREKKSAKRR